jgi:hypothetical protein
MHPATRKAVSDLNFIGPSIRSWPTVQLPSRDNLSIEAVHFCRSVFQNQNVDKGTGTNGTGLRRLSGKTSL